MQKGDRLEQRCFVLGVNGQNRYGNCTSKLSVRPGKGRGLGHQTGR